MPVINRRDLRQRLGREWIHDTVVFNTSGSWGLQTGSMTMHAADLADPTASGENMYERHWMRLIATVGDNQDLRIGSFNTGSGAFIQAVTLVSTSVSGRTVEVHSMLSPVDKDRALNSVIRDVRVLREHPIWAIDNGHVYSLGDDIYQIHDVRYLSDPSDSLNLGEHKLRWWKYEVTATGNQLRIDPSLPASYQLILKALVAVSLGAGELATVNLPSEDMILWGAAARCYWMIEQSSPGQETAIYKARRAEAAKEYTRLAMRFQPYRHQRPMLDEVW